MQVDGPRFGAVFKVNFKDVHPSPDNDYLRLRSPMEAIKDVFEGREDQAALVKAPDPKTQRQHTYVVTNDPDPAKEQSLNKVRRLVKSPSSGREIDKSESSFMFTEAHRFLLASIELLTGKGVEVPIVDFEYEARKPVRKQEFMRCLGLLDSPKGVTILEAPEEEDTKR